MQGTILNFNLITNELSHGFINIINQKLSLDDIDSHRCIHIEGNNIILSSPLQFQFFQK